MLRIVTAVASLLLLNFLLSLYRILPSARPELALLPVPELVVLVAPLLIATLAGWNGRSSILHLSAAIGTVLSAYGLGEGAIQMLYARAWEPVGDYPLIRSAILLYVPGESILVDISAGLILLLAATALYLVCVFSLRNITRTVREALADGVSLHAFAALGSVVFTVAIAGLAITGPQQSLSAATMGALQGDDFDLRAFENRTQTRVEGNDTGTSAEDADDSDMAMESVADPTANIGPEYDAPGFRDRDIYVFIVESYGIAVFDREEVGNTIRPKLEEVQTRLAESGYHSVSNFLESPIFGGQSWLAEATFLSGNRIDRQSRYEQLIDEGSDTIVKTLSDMADYYSVAIKPGNINGGWETEQDVYGFDEVLSAHDGDFEYEGPWFSFVPITDQFAIRTAHQRIQQLRRQDGEAADRPLYLHYQLVSSHLPFSRIPEVIEDWDDLGDGSIYHESDNRYFDNDYFRGDEYLEGYSASIDYVLEVITRYMTQKLPDDDKSLFIIHGDHQPGSVVSGQGASDSVPIHVLSRDQDLLRAWQEHHGYVNGMIPDQEPPHLPMEEMFPLMTEIATEEP